MLQDSEARPPRLQEGEGQEEGAGVEQTHDESVHQERRPVVAEVQIEQQRTLVEVVELVHHDQLHPRNCRCRRRRHCHRGGHATKAAVIMNLRSIEERHAGIGRTRWAGMVDGQWAAAGRREGCGRGGGLGQVGVDTYYDLLASRELSARFNPRKARRRRGIPASQAL